MLILTKADVLNDIAAYTTRIIAAEDKLAGLPATAPSWKERKKLKEKRRVLNDEIEHVERLIDIAKEALTGLE